jgi:hypothetical protein
MVLYHQTKKKNLNSILKYGLLVNSFGILYLSPHNNLNFGDITLEIETGDSKLTAFDDCKEWEVLCWNNISSNNIKVFEGK